MLAGYDLIDGDRDAKDALLVETWRREIEMSALLCLNTLWERQNFGWNSNTFFASEEAVRKEEAARTGTLELHEEITQHARYGLLRRTSHHIV